MKVDFSPFEIQCEDAVGHKVRITFKDGRVEETYCEGFTRRLDDEDGRASIDVPYTWYHEEDIKNLEIL